MVKFFYRIVDMRTWGIFFNFWILRKITSPAKIDQ